MNDRDVMNKIIAKIKALEDVISGGGGGGGGSGVTVIVNMTSTEVSDELVITSDKTVYEVYQMATDGKFPVAKLVYPDESVIYLPLWSCSEYQDETTGYNVMFKVTDVDGGEVRCSVVEMNGTSEETYINFYNNLYS